MKLFSWQNTNIHRHKISSIAWISGAILLVLPAWAYAQETRSLSLQEAVSLAQRDSKSWAQFDARAKTAEQQVEVVKSNWWPKLTFDASFVLWSDSSEIDVVDKKKLSSDLSDAMKSASESASQDPVLGAFLKTYGSALNSMVQSISAPLMNAIPSSISLKDDMTFTFGAQLTMPLTPLIKVYHGSKLAEMAVENVEVERCSKSLDISFEVTDVYLKLVYAQLMVDVAREASETIDKHVEKAEKYEAVGMISHSDVLAAKVESLKAKQQVVEANNGMRLASIKLGQVLSIGRGIELRAADTPEHAYEVSLDPLESYQDKALSQRKEFQRLDLAQRAASKKATIALLDYIPQLFLFGRYQYMNGIDALKPANQAMIGLGLMWTAFDGFGHHHESKKAEFESAEYSAKADEARDLIELDAAQKYLALSTALERVKLTQQALDFAEENLRTINAQFEQGESVNTDVLAAQTRRRAARADDVKARIDILAALAGLKLSMGEEPSIDLAAFQSASEK